MGLKLQLADVPPIAIADGRWQPLNKPLGITHFGVSAVVMDPGEAADVAHHEAESGHQEIYIVVAGRAAFTVADAEFEAGPGDIVAVGDPSQRRDYRALERDTRIVCIGAGPGAEEPFGEWITRASQ